MINILADDFKLIKATYPYLSSDELMKFRDAPDAGIFFKEYSKTKKEINIDQDNNYHIYPTLSDAILINQSNHFITEVDKIVWTIQILMILSNLYHENSNEITQKQSNEVGTIISDESFYIDSMKNIHLCSSATISNAKVQFHQNNKKANIDACGVIIEEIFKEKKKDCELYTNNGFYSYRNFHAIIDRILYKFPNKKGNYTNFKDIIKDFKKSFLYEMHSKDVEIRLINSEKYSKDVETRLINSGKHSCTLKDLVLSSIGGFFDINRECSTYFEKKRNENDKGNIYYNFFNLILYIFFPSYNRNSRKINYIDFLYVFDDKKKVEEINRYLIQKYLPSNEEFISISNALKEESIGFKKEEMISFKINESNFDFQTRFAQELSGEINEKIILTELKNIANFYFPESNDNESNNCKIFDYFGILEFLKNKDDVLYLVHPSISQENREKLNELPSENEIMSFFKNAFSDLSFCNSFLVLSTIDGFDSLQISHQLIFDVTQACFCLERKYIHDVFDKEFIKKIKIQDKILMNIHNSKYMMHLAKDFNQINYYSNSSVSVFPFLPTTLYNFISRNSRNRIINDADKILWAIQMAMAFRDLNDVKEYAQEGKIDFSDIEGYSGEEQIDFADSISDHSFFIDDMKNIYLCSLAFCNEREPDLSTTIGPFYYRSKANKSYAYTYGVLLNEIFTEIEPKTLFENMSRYERIQLINDGLNNFDMFDKYGEKYYNIYGQEIKNIVLKCLSNENISFSQIIDELKETKLYKKNQYIVDKREKEAKPMDSSRFFSFRSILISEISGINEMNSILTRFFEELSERYGQNEYQEIYDEINQDMQKSYPPTNYFNAINHFSPNCRSNIL